jgi:hypothetical protein
VVLRNDLLTAWMRRPLGVAVDATLDLARLARKDPAARTALRQATGRLRAALARRRVVPADVEEDLRTITTVTPAAGSPPR